ncbi:MAG: hypothetical protein K0S56_849 [Microvirga sp.]|jgi:uncharacterized pyridoxal phosphate-containing UPF0001 family protein|nr:hypothetical protein [Microvirga sp.]
MDNDDTPLSPGDIERFGPDPLGAFQTNLASVEERIARACQRAGRDRASVRLLPITKTVPAHILRYAFPAGIRSLGENKIQEAMVKHEALGDLALEWSIVGHLQTNKAKYLTRFPREFHALDSLRLADVLNTRLEANKRHSGLTGLSMGMTGDFEAAIEEGATVVRVGQAIFGKRPTPDGHYWPGFAGTHQGMEQ